MTTYYSPSSNMAIGTSGDIYTEGGQLGKMAFIDNLTTDLVQNGVDFLGEYFYRYAIETVGTNIDFTFSLIDNPIKPGYTVYIRNTGNDPISIREGSSNTILRTIPSNATVLFTAYQSGSPDIWYSYDVFFNSNIPVNYIYIDGTFGNDSTGIVDRIDFPFQTLNAGFTAANATSEFQVFFIRPGNYTYGNSGIPNSAYYYYFAPDTYITFGAFVFTAFDDSGTRIFGDANFTGPISMFGSSINCSLECNSINNVTANFRSFSYCKIREVIDSDINSTMNIGTDGFFCTIGQCIDSGINLNGRSRHNVLIDYFEKDDTNGQIIANTLGEMELMIRVKNMNILQFASGTITINDSRGTITVDNLVCIDDTGYIITSSSLYPINFILGNVNIVNRLFTTSSTDDSLFVNYLEASSVNLATFLNTSGNTTIRFNYIHLDATTAGSPIIDFQDETHFYGNYLHCENGDILISGTEIVEFDINEFEFTGSINTPGLIKSSTGIFVYKGNKLMSDGLGRVFQINGGDCFIDIAHITAPIDINARIFQVSYGNDTDVCNINFGIAEIGPYLLDLIRGVCNITGYYVECTGAAGGLIQVSSATLNADIKFAEHTNAYILTNFNGTGVPVNISSHVDECVVNNGSVISLGNDTFAIGYGSLIFSGRYVAAGTNFPITMAENANSTLRLEQASLISAGGAATASVQYTGTGTLTIENHGETAAQAPFNATVGSIVSVGTLSVAAYT